MFRVSESRTGIASSDLTDSANVDTFHANFSCSQPGGEPTNFTQVNSVGSVCLR